jgi:hypothetical protein
MSASPVLFLPLVGLVPFTAKKGHGSFVTFSLTSTPESPVEEFYFWVYLCYWWIRTADGELAHCESTDDEIVSAVSELNGRKLNEIVLHDYVTQDGLFHGASLSFAGDLTMKLCQYEDSPPGERDLHDSKRRQGLGFLLRRWLDQHWIIGLTRRWSERPPAARSRFQWSNHFHFRPVSLSVAVAHLVLVRL